MIYLFTTPIIVQYICKIIMIIQLKLWLVLICIVIIQIKINLYIYIYYLQYNPHSIKTNN